MRLPRLTPVAVAAALALSAGGVAVAAGHDPVGTDDGTTDTAVVNATGHEVDEHAAFGQATAALARQLGDTADDADETDAPDAPDEQDEADEQDGTDGQHGKAGQPHGHAGEHGQGRAYAFGHMSAEARAQAITEMQAEHASTHTHPTGPPSAAPGRSGH